MEHKSHMRTIDCTLPVRIGVRRDGATDGLVWRLFLTEGGEEIHLRGLTFSGTMSPENFVFKDDPKRDNPGHFLAWLELSPRRVEIADERATLHFPQ